MSSFCVMNETADTKRWVDLAAEGSVSRRTVAALGPAALVLAFQMVLFPVPLGVSLQGVVLGLLNALVVLGLILVYRANRVVNLAQASIGTLPATMAGAVVLFGAPSLIATGLLSAVAGLVVVLGAISVLRLPLARALLAAAAAMALSAIGLRIAGDFGWAGGLVTGLFIAVLSGIGIDAIVIQRFRRSPRLIVTVATIGLAQLFVVLGLLTPRVWGAVALVDPGGDRTGFEVPGDFTFAVGSTVFRSAEIVAVVISLVCIAAVSAALRWTHVGMAVRAAADGGDRASMLGIPVPRIAAGVWIVASVLAFLSTYIQAGILGLEITAGIGLRVMVASTASCRCPAATASSRRSLSTRTSAWRPGCSARTGPTPTSASPTPARASPSSKPAATTRPPTSPVASSSSSLWPWPCWLVRSCCWSTSCRWVWLR